MSALCKNRTKGLPRDPAQVAAWKRHGNFKDAAGEIGIAPTTLRARLMKWGDYNPHAVGNCNICGAEFRPNKNQRKCKKCRKSGRRKPRKQADNRWAAEYAPSVPERKWRCAHYHRCLDKAAHGSGRFTCNGCKHYKNVGKEAILGVGETCATKRLVELI